MKTFMGRGLGVCLMRNTASLASKKTWAVLLKGRPVLMEVSIIAFADYLIEPAASDLRVLAVGDFLVRK
jgi:hypothetical protein